VESGVTLNASGNWWGSNVEATVAGLINDVSLVDFNAYLGTGTDIAPSTIGFQGDFSDVYVTALGSQTGNTGRVQEGVNLVTTGGTVNVNAGTYADGVVTVPLDKQDLTVAVPTGATGFSLELGGATANNLTVTGAGAMDLTGNAADNVLTGNAGDNVLTGLAGNDTLSGGAGTNVLAGGEGVDTAVFAGNISDYTIVGSGLNLLVTSIDGFSPASSNTLTSIEKLDFEGQNANILVVGVGQAYTTIQSAINAASEGDTVLVYAGTYNEAIDITKANLTVKSISGAGSTFLTGVAATGETVRFTANGVTLGGVGAGFTINNQNTADGRAIAPTGTTGGAIVGNTIVNALRGIQGQFYGDPQDLTITDNTFSSSVSYGIASVGTRSTRRSRASGWVLA